MPSTRQQIRDLKKQIQELEDENETLQEKLDNIADVIQTDDEDDPNGED